MHLQGSCKFILVPVLFHHPVSFPRRSGIQFQKFISIDLGTHGLVGSFFSPPIPGDGPSRKFTLEMSIFHFATEPNIIEIHK